MLTDRSHVQSTGNDSFRDRKLIKLIALLLSDRPTYRSYVKPKKA